MYTPSVMMIGASVLVIIFGLIAAVTIAARNPRNLQRDNPNLAPCRDCGQYISTRAATCPHCGGPNKGV